MRLACAGDNVVDVYRWLGLMFPGGNAVNVAVAARRAGAATAYIGAIGTDEPGRLVLEALTDEGVDVTRARSVHGPNAYFLIELVDGERAFGDADLGVSRFSLNTEDLEYLSTFDLVHSGDNSMLENQIESLADVAAVSYDFGERPVDYWEPLVPFVRVACFSGAMLAPEAAEHLTRRAARLGPEVVLVTEGERGAMALDHDRVYRVGAEAKPLDTLGAGDTLIGTFLARLIAGATPPDALLTASHAAALTCSHHGAFGHPAPVPPGSSFAKAAETSMKKPPTTK